jgi:hypothetical protein
MDEGVGSISGTAVGIAVGTLVGMEVGTVVGTSVTTEVGEVGTLAVEGPQAVMVRVSVTIKKTLAVNFILTSHFCFLHSHRSIPPQQKPDISSQNMEMICQTLEFDVYWL